MHKKHFNLYKSRACKKVRAFLERLKFCSNGANPDYVSASCEAIRKQAMQTATSYDRKSHDLFIRCMSPDSRDYNHHRCAIYRKELSDDNTLKFCMQKSFKWYKREFCMKLRRRHFRAKFLASYTDKTRSQGVYYCFDS
ncbi:hypothetical protein KJ865_02455 [Myxococcota bacterium]|nr:hypothetical protein [Myxococcota bacterium]